MRKGLIDPPTPPPMMDVTHVGQPVMNMSDNEITTTRGIMTTTIVRPNLPGACVVLTSFRTPSWWGWADAHACR